MTKELNNYLLSRIERAKEMGVKGPTLVDEDGKTPLNLTEKLMKEYFKGVLSIRVGGETDQGLGFFYSTDSIKLKDSGYESINELKNDILKFFQQK